MIDAQIEAIGGGDYDLVITDGDLVLVGGTEDTHPAAVVQDLTYEFGTWFGESPFDRSVGFPWVESVFGVHPIEGIGALVHERAVAIERVEDLEDAPVLEFDPLTARLSIQIHAKGADFVVPVELEISPP